MIKTKEGTVEFSGSISEISADFSTIVHSYKRVLTEKLGESEECAKKIIMEEVETGLMTNEELSSELLKELSGGFGEMLKTLSDIIKDKKGEKADE